MLLTLPPPFDTLLPAQVLWPGAGIAASVALACWLAVRRRRSAPAAQPRVEPQLTPAAPLPAEQAAPKRVVVAPSVVLPEGVQFGPHKLPDAARLPEGPRRRGRGPGRGG